MPNYEYECNECGHRFEVKQSYDDDALVACPECSKSALHRVIFATPVHYKGAGFATTEARGITGHKRKPNIKVGLKADLPPDQQERME